MKKCTLLLGLTGIAGWAQVSVYSEFARIGASGDVIAPETPREILSPAVARNAFSAFQVVVQAEKGTQWRLFIGQNPENSFQVTLYRESGDRLERVDQPVASEGTQIFWVDLWVDRGARVERVKVEPQLDIHNDWVIYPMEVRVMNAIVPDGPRPQTEARTPVEIMREYVCQKAYVASELGPAMSTHGLRTRNAWQDLSLAGAAAGQGSKEELQHAFGACDAPDSADPEWYLRIRDYLLRSR
jgi:hypothetical protein